MFTLLLVWQNVVIASTEHVPAELNGQCDALSRRNSKGEFRNVSEVLPGARDLKVADDWRVSEALRLCDPKSTIPFYEFWGAAGRIIEKARSGR